MLSKRYDVEQSHDIKAISGLLLLVQGNEMNNDE